MYVNSFNVFWMSLNCKLVLLSNLPFRSLIMLVNIMKFCWIFCGAYSTGSMPHSQPHINRKFCDYQLLYWFFFVECTQYFCEIDEDPIVFIRQLWSILHNRKFNFPLPILPHSNFTWSSRKWSCNILAKNDICWLQHKCPTFFIISSDICLVQSNGCMCYSAAWNITFSVQIISQMAQTQFSSLSPIGSNDLLLWHHLRRK